MSTAGSHAAAGGSAEHNLRADLEALKADFSSLKTDLHTLVGDASVAGRHAAGAARDRFGQAAGAAREKARDAYNAAKAKGSEAAEAVEETIEEHPFASVGVAFGVGLLIGALIARR